MMQSVRNATLVLTLLALGRAAWGASDCAAQHPRGEDKSKFAGNGKAKEDWKPLFDGKSLTGWKSANFGGEGEVLVKDGAIVMEAGNNMTGATYTKGDFPKLNYEVSLEGKRLKGNDFFCTTTFPVGDTFCSLVMGGWGGSIVGLSSLDFFDASENPTTKFMDFKKDQWYKIRIRVTKERIHAWIEDKSVVDVNTKGKKISIRAECDLCKPFGIATWRTSGAVRNVKVRTLTAAELGEAKNQPGAANEPEKRTAVATNLQVPQRTRFTELDRG
jgi:hypothetical protein